MYKCLIIDDEKLARKLIENHLAKLNNFELIASCKSAIEASDIISTQTIDLLFLDIEMPVLQGVEFYKNLIHKPKVIFTTAYREYAIEGFELNAIDYLLKPITFPRFLKAIEKFVSQDNSRLNTFSFSTSHKEHLFITSDRKQVKVLFSDILYIESLKNYIRIKTNSKAHMVKHGISSFEKLLDKRFLRVHRSYIVNTNKVTAFTKHDVEIDDLEIPIGDSYKTIVQDFLK